MFDNWDSIVSVISAIVAVFALFQTSKQIRLSNKQSLFNRRLEAFIKINGLLKLYETNKKTLEAKKRNSPVFTVSLDFLWLTNNTFLQEVGETIKFPSDNSKKKQLLHKLEDMKKLAVETEVIFRNNNAVKIASKFISDYERMLFIMYQYQILLNEMQDYSRRFNATLEKSQKEVNEVVYRKELFIAYDAVKRSYDSMVQSKALDKLKKQIIL